MTKNQQLTKNFNIIEFACHDGAAVPGVFLGNVTRLAQNLQVLRDSLGSALFVVSGYRGVKYNKRIGGVSNSQHLQAKAADVVSPHFTPEQIHERIEQLIAEGKMMQGGLGLYKGFVHYDIRGTKARWINI